MNQPSAPNNPTSMLMEMNMRQIRDLPEQRLNYLRYRIATIHEAWRRGESYSAHDIHATLAEYRDLERQLGRRLPSPFDPDLIQQLPVTRVPRNPPADPFHRGVRHSRAQEQTSHNRSAYRSGESGAVPLRSRRGEDVFDQASPYAPNPLQPLAPPQVQPLPGILPDWSDITPSPGLHHRRSTFNSVSHGMPTRLRAEVPSFIPRLPAPSPAAPLPPVWPSLPNAYASANANPTYHTVPVPPTPTEPRTVRGYLGWNSSYVQQTGGTYSPLPRPALPTFLDGNLQGGNAVESTLRGNWPVESNFQRNQPGEGNSQGNQPGEGSSQGNQSGEGSSQGNQSGEGSSQGNQPGEGNSQGNQPGEGNSSGDSETDLMDPMLVEFANGTLSEALNRVGRDRDTSSSISEFSGSSSMTSSRNATGLDVDDGRPPARTAEELKVNLECKICYTQRSSVALIPCGHCVMCKWCADQVVPSHEAARNRPARHTTCPMCRKSVSMKWDLFMGD